MSIHPLGDTLLRTLETFKKYHNNPKRKGELCFICSAVPLQSYSRWAIIINDFPYDAVAEVHVMLVPKRHVSNAAELTKVELEQLEDIKSVINEEGEYDALIEDFSRGRSFEHHYHLHLLRWKRV